MIALQRRSGLFVHRDQPVEDVPDEPVGRRAADVDRVVRIVLDRAIAGGVGRIGQEEPRRLFFRPPGGDQSAVARIHRPDCRARVPRHVERRDDLHLPRGSVAEQAHVVLGGEEAASRSLGERAAAELGQQALVFLQVVAPPGADFGQFGQALDGEPPSLVVGEMEMEAVELVGGHLVDQRADRFGPVEIACDVEMQPAKAEARGILDRERRDIATAGAHQRREALHRIERACGVTRGDRDGLAGNPQPIGLGAQCRIGFDDERNTGGRLRNAECLKVRHGRRHRGGQPGVAPERETAREIEPCAFRIALDVARRGNDPAIHRFGDERDVAIFRTDQFGRLDRRQVAARLAERAG